MIIEVEHRIAGDDQAVVQARGHGAGLRAGEQADEFPSGGGLKGVFVDAAGDDLGIEAGRAQHREPGGGSGSENDAHSSDLTPDSGSP